MSKKIRLSYKKFYDSLDDIAPLKPYSKDDEIKVRMFFGQRFRYKKDIVRYVKSFPQLDSFVYDYKEYDLDKNYWDMWLVLWISAIKFGDWEYADNIREKANAQGVTLSRFKGNVVMRTP